MYIACMTWFIFALLSALFAAFTAILAKIGVEGIPSTLATAIRTSVILPFTWLVVALSREHHALTGVSRRTLTFLVLSGLATGFSWLAYFRALQLGPASRVAPIDKLSLPITALLAGLFLGERLTLPVLGGVTLMAVGALLTLL